MVREAEAAGIRARRLVAHHLAGELFTSPVQAVHWLGAVQSQDYGAAKWSVAQRCRGATDAELDRLFDEGRILRTHVLRPTWHFVLPDDVGWMLGLTAPRILNGVAGRYRELGIDARTVARAEAVFADGLAGGRHLTRAELGGLLAARGISPEGQRLPHLIMAAELHGLVVSGPRRVGQFTYALLAERVREPRRLADEEALAELARRYFRSRGPAQLQDFAWWSSLTLAQARAGVVAAGPALERHTIRGTEHWGDGAAVSPPDPAGIAHLLPNFDEYTISYRDRTVLLDGHPFDPHLFSLGSVLSNVVTIGGRIRGAWRRSRVGPALRLEIRRMGRMSGVERRAVEAVGDRLGSFLGRPVHVNWMPS